MKKSPGKFEACGNHAKVSQYIYDNCDEDLGDVEYFGWYGKFSGKIKGHGPFHAIINEDSNGFVNVTYFDTEEELESKWANISADYDEAQGPNEDDITTEDHRKFYQYRKLILTVDEEGDYKQALRDYMEKEGFFPNVWFISDHGNARILDLKEKT